MSTTNKLAQVIRKIVREEVRKEVRTLLNEQKTKPASKAKLGLKKALGLTETAKRRVTTPKEQVVYTKNTMLNNILNETAGQLRENVEEVEYPTMGGKSFSAPNAHTFSRDSLAAKMGYGNPTTTPTVEEMIPNTDVRGRSSQGMQVDAGVAKALTRDYSELVKKFNKK
tara:strand:- start:843 stop:1349 length:507 start_codon:yes stop_codon:yes gene_type:complete